MPTAMGKLLDLLGVDPPKRATSRLLDAERDAGRIDAPSHRLKPGVALPAARPDLSALCRAGGRRAMRLIDSHCHLDFPDFADEIEAVVARAGAAGVERLMTISTRVRQGDRLVALAERFPQCLFHDRHASSSGGRGGGDRRPRRSAPSPRIPNASAIGEAGLDYHYDYAPRDVAAQRVSRADRARARARTAARDPRPRRRRRHRRDPARGNGEGRFRRPCCIASPRRARSPRPGWNSASTCRSRAC